MRFIGIGVGPGDSSLLTLKAVECLKKVDVLLAASSEKSGKSYSLEIVKKYLTPKTEVIKAFFTMSDNKNETVNVYDRYADLVNEHVNRGKDVGFLCIGDPLLYGTYGRLISIIKSKYPDIIIETIPGITSFSAASSKMNRVIAMDDDYLAVLPAYKYENVIKIGKPDSLILMKVYKDREKIINFLKKYGFNRDILYAENVGLEDEYFSTSFDNVLLRNEKYLSLLFAKKELFIE
ncbi:MAG: precorrin-2 C(20)-methyltransferase [Deltaproteobacteria bacterium]|nr:precorrin-2 C(20)-methyltransferase [Deltaproteobacteria bacterium]